MINCKVISFIFRIKDYMGNMDYFNINNFRNFRLNDRGLKVGI